MHADDETDEPRDLDFFAAQVADVADSDDAVDYQTRFDDAKLKDIEAARDYRKWVIKFTIGVVGVLVVGSCAVMGVYLGSEWRQVNPTVPIAFFTSVVVESIGILYVITQHLFPNGKDDNTPPSG